MIMFHRFLIGTAIIFCATFAWWSYSAFRVSGSVATLSLAIAFGIAAVALVYYLKNLLRILHS